MHDKLVTYMIIWLNRYIFIMLAKICVSLRFFIFSRNCYDMKNIHLDAKIALKKDVGGTKSWCSTSDDNVGFVNNILSSMISSCHVKLNDVLINNSADQYHLKSYIQV